MLKYFSGDSIEAIAHILGSFIGNDFTGINIKGDVFAMIKRGFKHSFIDLL
jgi:hypothetical protein